MAEEHTEATSAQMGKLEIGPGPWQRLGQLLDQIGTPERGAEYLRSTKQLPHGMATLDLIEKGGIEKVLDQLAADVNTKSL